MNKCKSQLLYQIMSLLLLAMIACMFTGVYCKAMLGERFLNRYIDRHYPAVETVAAKPAAPVITTAPTVAANANEYVLHTVTRGETLFTIAHSYTGDGQKFREIARYNNIDPNAVEVGDVIKIPESMIK